MGDYVLLSKLSTKDVVNIATGEKLGKIRDLDIDITTGKINYFIVSVNQNISNLFKNNRRINIDFSKIVKVGDEIILVEK